MKNERTIYVYENWSNNDDPVLLGKLFESIIRGQESYSFEYDQQWLDSHKGSISLDPDLSFYSGRQYAPLDKKMFGLFSDSCPDRWGRLLMNRKNVIEARKNGKKPIRMSEIQYLLGVYDESRMGALRFSIEPNGPFLSNDETYATPPWINLRTLEDASWQFEKDEINGDEKWLKELLAPGSSLGGARPKASVLAQDGTLWIAKFPSKHDEYDIGAWEKIVHDLARMCGLNVPESRLEKYSNNGSTFLVKRFDRERKRRLHFSSAMTLLGKTDGSSANNGISYLDLASFIRTNGADVKKDLKELWKRVVFNMAVSNTDDHLRNHGFILSRKGWKLSPVFDVNPVPYGNRLSLNVNENDNSLDYELALEVAKYFDLSKDEAEMEESAISTIVSNNWLRIAVQYGLDKSSIEYMRPAFSLKR